MATSYIKFISAMYAVFLAIATIKYGWIILGFAWIGYFVLFPAIIAIFAYPRVCLAWALFWVCHSLANEGIGDVGKASMVLSFWLVFVIFNPHCQMFWRSGRGWHD